MIVQSTSALFSAAAIARSPAPRQTPTTSPANIADTVSISKAAWEALATSAANVEKSVEARLAAIKAKDAVGRTQEDHDYLFANDKKLAEITRPGQASRRTHCRRTRLRAKGRRIRQHHGKSQPGGKGAI